MNKSVVLITGASSGLGAALVNQAMKDGHYVVATFRKEEQASQFSERNEGRGEGVYMDLTDEASISQGVENIISNHGRLDMLVNNAGVGFAGAVEEASLEEVRGVFEANFFGTLSLTQKVLPHMRKAGQGHIIQISSHAGVKAFAGFGIYNASKFALEGFSEAMAQEIAPLGIKVLIVEPGPFRTNFAGRSLKCADREIRDYKETSGAFRTMLKGVHDKQEGDPEKAAKIILEYVKEGRTGLRLALGKVPLKTIGMKIDSLRKDLEENKELSEKAVF